MPSEAFEAGADQGLLADGGGVHQEPGEAEAPGGEERGGAEQGRHSQIKIHGFRVDKLNTITG